MSSIRRTVAGSNNFDFSNGKRGRDHRGGTIEILDFTDDERTRIDVYATTAGVRLNASAHDTDAYTRTLAAVSQTMWAAEGARPSELEPMTDEDFREVARTALGVCQFTGRLNCQERDCELHYMAAPLTLAPDLGTTYEGRQIQEVLTEGPNPDTGGKFHVRFEGATVKTHWLTASEDQLRRIAAILAENEQ